MKIIDIRESGKNVFWNCIVITSSLPRWRNQIESEMLKLKESGLLPPHDILLVINDPQSTCGSFKQSYGVGSGGATINALLVVAERLSALEGYTTINPDILAKYLILIIHFGRNSYHYPGGNAFIPLCSGMSWLPPSIHLPLPASVLLNSIWMGSLLASNSTTGVWVTSLDFIVSFNDKLIIPDTSLTDGAIICSVTNSSLEDKTGDHGILESSSDGNILCATYSNISSIIGKEKQLICGTAFLSSSLAEAVLSLYNISPLDRCTYYGTDNACEPVQISLYFDLLLPLFSGVDKTKYLSGELGHRYAVKAKYESFYMEERCRARWCIWNQLEMYKANEHPIATDCCYYLSTNIPFNSIKPLFFHSHSQVDVSQFNSINVSLLYPVCKSSSENDHYQTANELTTASVVKKYVPSFSNKSISSHILLFNSISHSNVNLTAAGDCLFTDFKLGKPSDICLGSRKIWQCWPLLTDSESSKLVLTCHGFDDYMKLEKSSKLFTIFNHSWEHFSERTLLDSSDLWPHSDAQTLANACLFPCEIPFKDQINYMESFVCSLESSKKLCDETTSAYSHCNFLETISFVAFDVEKWKKLKRISFQEILLSVDLRELFDRRDKVFLKSFQDLVKSTAHLKKSPSFIPFFKYIAGALPGDYVTVLKCFHEAMMHSSAHHSRLLANVADFLGCLAGTRGGLRSGPAGNKKFAPALELLKKGRYTSGNDSLRIVCEEFIESGRPEDIIRASRHYERASQIMISEVVEASSKRALRGMVRNISSIPSGLWVEASSAARLDLSGGWSDTPPICYELGGSVVNVSIKVNGIRPIGAKARIVKDLKIIYIQEDSSGSDLKLTWSTPEDILDYDNPVSSGALTKASLIYTKFVDTGDSSRSLKDQLKERYNGGLELIVWSKLAQGSGLGGSSILAGCILAVLFILTGNSAVSSDALIHATLGIEQMITTGGGWQDQVGGLIGGFKLGLSLPSIPFVIEAYKLPVSQSFVEFLNRRLLLVYTGKIRLARNLLQTVLRNWYSGEIDFVQKFQNLGEIALEAAKYVLSEDITNLGRCVDDYWSLKKAVTPGSEPAKAREIMDFLKPHVLGQCLAGAGGGGYLFAIMKEPIHSEILNNLTVRFHGISVSSVEIELEGLMLSVGGKRFEVDNSSCVHILTEDVLKSLHSKLYPFA